jgi:hypothetical protein
MTFSARAFSAALAALLCVAPSPAADDAAPASAAPPLAAAKRTCTATRSTGPAPAIDGRLDDGCWRHLGT